MKQLIVVTLLVSDSYSPVHRSPGNVFLLWRRLLGLALLALAVHAQVCRNRYSAFGVILAGADVGFGLGLAAAGVDVEDFLTHCGGEFGDGLISGRWLGIVKQVE